MEHKQYIYKAIVTKVVDGDTFDLKIDLGFDVTVKHRIRLNGADAYETSLRGDTTEEEKRKGIEAKEFLIERILYKEVVIETIKDKKGKYGRYIASVCIDGKMVSDLLLEKGYVKEK